MYVLSFGSKRENQRKLPLFRRSGPTTKGLLAPWTPKVVGRGRAGLKNRQDTFFDAPPTRSRLTAPPKKFADVGIFTRLFPSYGWFVGNGLDRSGRFAVTAN